MFEEVMVYLGAFLLTWLNLADIALTLHALSRGLIEGNPVMSCLIGQSVGIFVTTKVLVCMGVAIWCIKRHTNAIWVGVVMLGATVLWNVYALTIKPW